MAIYNPSGLTLTNNTVGLKFTRVTDSSVDWSGVTGNTYFFDVATQLPYYKNVNNFIYDIFTGSTNVLSQSFSGTTNITTISGSSSTAAIVISGSNTIGGTGYTDFIRVTNTAAGATNINKTFRINNIGDFEIVNSAYNTTILTLTDAGVISTPGGGTSDKRTKTNIEYISEETLPILMNLKPVKFEFKNYPNIVRHGFIAQDVLDVKKDLVLGDGYKENGVYGLDYDGILGLTVKSLQEANKKIENLEKIIIDLKNKIDNI